MSTFFRNKKISKTVDKPTSNKVVLTNRGEIVKGVLLSTIVTLVIIALAYAVYQFPAY